MRRLVLAAVVLTALALAPAAGATVRFFHSPSGNIECEMRVTTNAKYAYCQTNTPARSARLSRTGRTTICRGGKCVGDAPEGATTLAYGRSITVGRFRCTSRRTGMRCVMTLNGHGFRINRSGVATF